MDQFTENATPLGLYDPQFEHDACGIGAVVDIKGRKSHQTVSDALSIVERLEHRAGKDAEGKTGDGVGIMLQISHKFFSKVADELNISLGNEREYGVGMFFFPQNEHLRAQAMKLFELVTRKEGLEFLAWRRVPVDPDAVGQKARDCMPSIWQCFIKKPAKVSKGIDFDRKLYVVRRVFEQASNGTYVPSLSSRTIVYKGMFLVHDLRLFYADLQDPDYESAIGMVHSRFSTNTNPSWMRAHPNRFILHNGEINTIKGNTDAMLAREESIESPILQDDMNKILPIINTSGSDSAMLDNALEFMVMNGMDLPLAVMITIPEPWENNKNISQKKRDFYQYYATMLEPWDGPAAILFSDGDVVGAVLDRNGLRPSRYYITKDGRMILSSEVGVLPCEPENILVKDRLRPGKMLLVDTVKGEVVDDEKLLVKGMKFNLENEGYEVECAYDGAAAVELARTRAFDLLILDVMMPEVNGFELCRQLRERDARVPIIMLSAKSDIVDKGVGFAAGCDDYIAKPFNSQELAMRIEAQLRRARLATAGDEVPRRNRSVVRLGDMEVRLKRNEVLVHGRYVNLTPKEFQIIAFLANHAGEVFSAQDIMANVWGEAYRPDSASIAVFVRKIRSKIEDDPAKPRYLQTVWREGYRLGDESMIDEE